MNKTHLYFRSKAGVEVFDHRSGHQGGNEAGQGVDSRTCLPAIRLALSGHLCKADISSCPKNTNHSVSSNDALSQLHQLFRAISPSPESTSEVCPPSRARPCGLAMVEIHPWCGPASQEQQMKGCESHYLLHISIGIAEPNCWSQKPTCAQNLWYWSQPLSGNRQFLCRPSPVNGLDTSYDSEVLVYALDTITGSDFCLVAPLLPLWPWRQFQNREKQSHVSVCLDHPTQRSPSGWQFLRKIFSTSSQE